MKTISRIAITILLCIIFQPVHSQNTIMRRDLQPIKSNTSLKWINSNGFDVMTYQWDNDQLNNILRKAVEYRRGGHALVGLSGCSAGLAMTIHFLTALFHSSYNDTDSGYVMPGVVRSIYALSGVFLSSAVISGIIARRKVREAAKMRIQF